MPQINPEGKALEHVASLKRALTLLSGSLASKGAGHTRSFTSSMDALSALGSPLDAESYSHGLYVSRTGNAKEQALLSAPKPGRHLSKSSGMPLIGTSVAVDNLFTRIDSDGEPLGHHWKDREALLFSHWNHPEYIPRVQKQLMSTQLREALDEGLFSVKYDSVDKQFLLYPLKKSSVRTTWSWESPFSREFVETGCFIIKADKYQSLNDFLDGEVENPILLFYGQKGECKPVEVFGNKPATVEELLVVLANAYEDFPPPIKAKYDELIALILSNAGSDVFYQVFKDIEATELDEDILHADLDSVPYAFLLKFCGPTMIESAFKSQKNAGLALLAPISGDDDGTLTAVPKGALEHLSVKLKEPACDPLLFFAHADINSYLEGNAQILQIRAEILFKYYQKVAADNLRKIMKIDNPSIDILAVFFRLPIDKQTEIRAGLSNCDAFLLQLDRKDGEKERQFAEMYTGYNLKSAGNITPHEFVMKSISNFHQRSRLGTELSDPLLTLHFGAVESLLQQEEDITDEEGIEGYLLEWEVSVDKQLTDKQKNRVRAHLAQVLRTYAENPALFKAEKECPGGIRIPHPDYNPNIQGTHQHGDERANPKGTSNLSGAHTMQEGGETKTYSSERILADRLLKQAKTHFIPLNYAWDMRIWKDVYLVQKAFRAHSSLALALQERVEQDAKVDVAYSMFQQINLLEESCASTSNKNEFFINHFAQLVELIKSHEGLKLMGNKEAVACLGEIDPACHHRQSFTPELLQQFRIYLTGRRINYRTHMRLGELSKQNQIDMLLKIVDPSNVQLQAIVPKPDTMDEPHKHSVLKY